MKERCLEDAEDSVEDSVKAGSAEASAIPTPSADGFHGYQGGGGLTQASGFHTMEPLGLRNTWDTDHTPMCPIPIQPTHLIKGHPIRQEYKCRLDWDPLGWFASHTTQVPKEQEKSILEY